MRDKRFIAEHRGGPLTKSEHYQLMKWAVDCAIHVLPLLGGNVDSRLTNALKTAEAWVEGKASVGDARKAAVQCHTVAREAANPTEVAVAHAFGHAVATAHMADHSLGPAWYALRAVKSAGGSVEAERKWQDEQLPAEIKELVLSARKSRGI
jgi:hypothetical protein